MLFYISLIKCLEYYLKDYFSENYVTSEENNYEAPYFSKIAKPDLFDITDDPSGPEFNIIKALTADQKPENQHRYPRLHSESTKNDYSGFVITIADMLNTLIYFPFSKKDNQYLTLVKSETPDKFKIVHKRSCVGYNKEEQVFELVNCDNKNRVSWFSLVPKFKYKGPTKSSQTLICEPLNK